MYATRANEGGSYDNNFLETVAEDETQRQWSMVRGQGFVLNTGSDDSTLPE
jgi:hypothetical protein